MSSLINGREPFLVYMYDQDMNPLFALKSLRRKEGNGMVFKIKTNNGWRKIEGEKLLELASNIEALVTED